MATSLRDELEGDDVPRQAMALLQVLNAIANGNDVGSLTSVVCRAIIHGSAPAQCKRLAYDVVKAGGLADQDWDEVCEGLKSDIGSQINLEVQCAALEVLPLVPPFKLAGLLAEGSLHPKITPALRSPLREIRAATLNALAGIPSRPGALSAFGSSPATADSIYEWIGGVGDALLDASHAVAAGAHACARQWLAEPAQVLGEPEGTLKHEAAVKLTGRALAALSAILSRAQLLPISEQASAAAMLVELVTFADRHHVAAAKPPAPPPPPGSGAGSLLGTDVAPSAAAADPSASSAALYIGQAAEFLQPLLSSLDPPLVFEAAKGLLALGALSSTQSPSVALPTWAPLAVSALVELWDKAAHVPAGSQLLQIIVNHLPQLQPLAQMQLARQLIPMAATVPSAEARTQALAKLWLAMLTLELQARRANRSGDRAVSAAELKNVLSDPLVFELISGNPVGPKENVAAAAKYPAFREELVSTLLYTLRHHAAGCLQNVRTLSPAAGSDSAVQQNVGGVLRSAAGEHARSQLCDWLSATKICLQGTKACLGWDRGDASAGVHPSTLPVDLWLGLLQHALHAIRMLGHAVESTPLGREVASNRGALQELLSQLIVHWKVLSPAVQPRALWLAAHHAPLGAALDSAWAGLLRALADALSGNEEAVHARRLKGARAAAAEGIMAAADSSTLSRGAADPFGTPTLDEGATSAEAAEVGLLAAERLAALVLHKVPSSISPAMKELTASLAAVVQPGTQHGRGGADARERCTRLLANLSRALSVPVAQAPEDPAQQGQVPALVPDPSWAVQEGYPLAAPFGSTLQGTRRVTRYWALHDLVTAAVSAALNSSSEAPRQQTVQALPGPHLPSLLEVMSLVSEASAQGTLQEVTGPADPLRVAIAHVLQLQEGTLSLRIALTNRLPAEVKNVVVRIAVSGPVVPDSRQPPLYKVAALPAGETLEWRLRLRLSGFGAIAIQPLLTLPARSLVLPGDDPSIRPLALTIPALDLLVKPAHEAAPAAFFQRWASLPAGVTLSGAAASPGAQGGLEVLSALEQGPWALVSLQPLPAQGGFHAAFSSATWDGMQLALLILGHLVPTAQGGHVLCRVAVRSSSPAAAQALAGNSQAFLPALTHGALANVWDLEGLHSSWGGVQSRAGNGTSSQIAGIAHLYASNPATNGDTRAGLSDDVVAREWLRARNASIAA